jgi:DeoR/GlpR family transcriptional regulator of sugar metabolism
VQVKKAMIESSEKVVALSIAEKINTAQSIKICVPGALDILITELDPEEALFQPFKASGITVL